MKCIILAAGYATRLYPLTKNFPKPLLKVGEKTIFSKEFCCIFIMYYRNVWELLVNLHLPTLPPCNGSK